MEKIKIVLKYRKDGRLNNATVLLKKKMLEYIGTDNNVVFQFKNKEIIISSGESTTTFEKIENGKIELIKNMKIQKDRKVNIPLGILKDFGVNLEKENYITVSMKEKKLYISLINEVTDPIVKEGEKTMGEIFTIKVNKGGVGKTFVTVQLGSYLALQGKKVLLLTSDSQNNIIDYLGKNKDIIGKGLKAMVLKGDGEVIKLRENLYFIPLESSTFGTQFLLKLPSFLEKLKQEYDYIFIDSIPTMKIDSVFVQCSDKLIIPCFCDKVTVEGAINVIKEAGVDKVLAIIINKYENKKVQNYFKEEITSAIEGTDILFPTPIVNTSEIELLLFKGKTVWESNNKKVKEIQDSLKEVGNLILRGQETLSKDFDIDF